MLRKLFTALILLVLPLTSIIAHDHGFEGIYNVVGVDPATGPYTGTAVINQVGPVYVGTWTFPDPSGPIIEPATGLVQDGILSFVYLYEGAYGVISYESHQHGRELKGIWTSFGSAQLGSETLTKISENTR